MGRRRVPAGLGLILVFVAGCAQSDQTQDAAAPSPTSSPSSSATASPSSPAIASPSDSPDNSLDHEGEVVDVFAEYRRAVESKDGETTASLVAEPTLEYYERMSALALGAKRARLQRSALADQVTALVLRQLFLPKELKSMDGEDVVAAAVETGIIDFGSRGKFKPGDVSVLGETATLDMTKRGRTILSLTFRFEDEGWKLDPVSLNPAIEIFLRKVMKRKGLGETEFVVGVVSVFTGTTLTEAIYQPPGSDASVPTA